MNGAAQRRDGLLQVTVRAFNERFRDGYPYFPPFIPPQVAAAVVLFAVSSQRTIAVVTLAYSLKLFPGRTSSRVRGNDARCTMKRAQPSKSPAMAVSTRLWMAAVLCEVKCWRGKLTEKLAAGFDERQVAAQHLSVGYSRCVCKPLRGLTY